LEKEEKIMPFPFHCIECNEPVEEAFNGVCDKCKEEEE
tara:strand:+ start:133 stop:246 length:114 start_codon:yes stop_codon:yes gene_type:complete